MFTRFLSRPPANSLPTWKPQCRAGLRRQRLLDHASHRRLGSEGTRSRGAAASLFTRRRAPRALATPSREWSMRCGRTASQSRGSSPAPPTLIGCVAHHPAW